MIAFPGFDACARNYEREMTSMRRDTHAAAPLKLSRVKALSDYLPRVLPRCAYCNGVASNDAYNGRAVDRNCARISCCGSKICVQCVLVNCAECTRCGSVTCTKCLANGCLSYATQLCPQCRDALRPVRAEQNACDSAEWRCDESARVAAALAAQI